MAPRFHDLTVTGIERQTSDAVAIAFAVPDDLRDAYEDALGRGPRWRERIAASLKRMPETADRLKGA